MKRNNKKGFTIVELVIVIAVIAILSAVLIPTFGTVIADANEVARDEEAKNIYTTYITKTVQAGKDPATEGYIVIDGYYYNLTDGNVVVEGNQGTTSVAKTTVCYDKVNDNLYAQVPCTTEDNHTHTTE